MKATAILLLGMSAACAAYDLQRPPSAADAAQVATLGWAPSASDLEEALSASWKPGQGGSSSSESFRQWLALYRWCRLLGTPEPDALRAYLGRRVVEDPGNNRALLVIPPGQPLPTDATGRPLPTAADKLGDANVPPGILQKLLPEDYTALDGPLSSRAKQDFLVRLASDKEFLAEFFRELSPDDYPAVALTRLAQFEAVLPARWNDYKFLALAFALVYDQRPPDFWPHHQVDQANLLRMQDPVAERYAYYVKENDAGHLATDLRRLPPAALKFAVDAPVARTELEWASKNVKTRRERFADVFSSVKYDKRRATEAIYRWPNGFYLLRNIALVGGICVDQAYYASMCGKARGIPTLMFVGQGTDGGHAWFGYLGSNGKWDLDAGRYLNQNYTVGQALDPQTWIPITDHELLYLSGKAARAPGYEAACTDLVMAEVFARRGDGMRRLAAAENAIGLAPGLVAAWEEKERALEARGDRAGLRAHYARAIDQFRNEEDLKVRYQARLAALEREGGNAQAASQLEDRVIRENRRGRSDLSVAAAGEAVSRLVAAGDYDGAMREFKTLTGKLGDTGGGNLFYEVVKPFVLALRAGGRTKDADKALQLAKRAMPIEPGSILARDFDALEKGS